MNVKRSYVNSSLGQFVWNHKQLTVCTLNALVRPLYKAKQIIHSAELGMPNARRRKMNSMLNPIESDPLAALMNIWDGVDKFPNNCWDVATLAMTSSSRLCNVHCTRCVKQNGRKRTGGNIYRSVKSDFWCTIFVRTALDNWSSGMLHKIGNRYGGNGGRSRCCRWHSVLITRWQKNLNAVELWLHSR